MKRYPKRARPLWGAPSRVPFAQVVRRAWGRRCAVDTASAAYWMAGDALLARPSAPIAISFGPGVEVDATDWTPKFDGPIRHVGSIGVIAFDSPGGPVDQFHQALAEASRDGAVLTMPHGATFEIVEVTAP